MQNQEKIKYVFMAEISTPKETLTEEYISFLDDMLNLNTSELSDEELNLLLDEMNFYFDIKDKSIILTYER